MLTHEHDDGVLDLDDVREMQKFSVDWKYVTRSFREKTQSTTTSVYRYQSHSVYRYHDCFIFILWYPVTQPNTATSRLSVMGGP